MQTFTATQELIHDLQQVIRGEVRFDELTRQIYSTDASSYRIVPVGVVIPRDADDVVAAIELANHHKIPIIPRGGGTSLSGQTIGAGLILDHSLHLSRILEINPEEQWVQVEAGVVLDNLNAAVRPHGLMVGPDPASSAAATIGGMTGNNSSGTHSIQYGMMIDHVREVEVVLANGKRVQFGPKTQSNVMALAKESSLEGKIYRDIPELVTHYRNDIATRYPKTWRNVAGYNLNRLLADQEAGRPFDLSQIIVGSEGTLANILNVTLSLVPRPHYSRLMVLSFDDLRVALETVPFILESKPAAIELVDRLFIRLTRPHAKYGPLLNSFIQGDPRAVLIVEFADNAESALIAKTENLEMSLRRRGYQGKVTHCITPETVSTVWTVRKAGLGLLMSKRGDAKPLAFVDDATVPVERLADYALEVEKICREADVEAAFYAHASAGCLHINPLINLKTTTGLAQMQAISKAVAETAIAYGGTTTGEHGEGMARSYFNEQLYGSRLHQAFREVKGLFDPHNLMNPGKIIDASVPWEPGLLRMNPDYQTPQSPQETYLDFSNDGGFTGMVEMCNGQGSCRQQMSGTMCPSFKATRDETHATRGRANALRAAMTGQLGPDGMFRRDLYDALDLCLECKACKRECPSLVDMAKLKYEYLAHYQAEHGVPLRSWLFGHIALLNRLGSFMPRLTNWGFKNPLFRWLLDRALGIDQRRELPLIAPRSFQHWFYRRPSPGIAPRGPVVLWDDTYLSYNNPEIGMAAVRVLEAAGFEVKLIKKRRCCGRPMISKGLLKNARENATHNVELLAPYAVQGIPIIGTEPSCIATFQDEYPDLLRTKTARQVASNSFFIEEFLAQLIDKKGLDLPFITPSQQRHILVHGHCYQKALTGTDPILNMLRMIPNSIVEEISSGCCGMAGAFGYEKEHYEISQAIGNDVLFQAVRAAAPSVAIAASGTSCRHQILEGTGTKALHPIIVLANSLATRDGSLHGLSK